MSSLFFLRAWGRRAERSCCSWQTVAYVLAQEDLEFAGAVVVNLKKRKVDLQWRDVDLHFRIPDRRPIDETSRTLETSYHRDRCLG
jgi:hypothetical protein